MKEKSCKFCGKKFNRNFKKMDKKRGKFCSRDCYYASRKSKRVIVTCENCGKTSERTKWRVEVKPSEHYFCSLICFHQFRVKNPKLYPHNGPKEHYPQITKEILEEMYTKKRMTIKEIKTHFGCGYGTLMKKMRRLGIVSRQPKDYFQWDGKESLTHWKKVLNEEVGKCQICGWDKGTCDVHHRTQRRNEGKDTKENLILICPNCHRLIHEKKLMI